MKNLGKKALFAVAVAASFLLGYAGVSAAVGVPDRGARMGYFLNQYDPSGKDVFIGGIYTANATDFINFIKNKLYNGNAHEKTGAAFIIQTMLGQLQRDRPPTAAQMADWEGRVRWAEQTGRVNWGAMMGYSINSYYQDDHNDAGFFFSSGVSDSIVFYNESGAPAYILRKVCANPLGDTSGIPPKPAMFEFDSTSFVQGRDRGQAGAPNVTGRKNLLVFPGDQVKFSHQLWNWGSDPGLVQHWAWKHPRNTTPTPSPQWQLAPAMVDAPFRSNPGAVTLAAGQNIVANSNNFVIPANAQPGDTFCQHLGFYWTGWNKPYGTDDLGQQACAEVSHNYTLLPSATASKSTAIEGEKVSFSFQVQNSGQTVSKPTNWKVYELIVQPGSTINQGPNYFDNASCATFAAPGVTCRQVHDGGNANFPLGMTTLPNNPGTEATLNYPPGTKVCRVLAVDPPEHTATPRNRFSRPSCVSVVKFPKVHFMGGDLSVGNPYQSASASCALRENTGSVFTAVNGPTNGSVEEYAAFVRGVIEFQQAAGRGFGTASRPATNRIDMQKLSFANTQSEAGRFGSNDCMIDYYAKFSPELNDGKIPAPGNITLSATKRQRYTGDVTINTSNIANGARILIVADGNVTIAGNIRYSGSYANTSQIPSVAIIASGDITINEGVTQLDGAFISKKTIHTCNEISIPLTTGDCNQQLTVNGVIITDKLNLRRTYGAENPDIDKPAERFNYTTEMFFNNVLEDGGDTIDTIEQRDLPPRY